MKKALLTLSIAIGYYVTYGQNTTNWPSTGPVGIGTTTPALNLHVDGTTGFPANSGTSQTGIMRLGVAGGYGSVLDFGSNGSLGQGWIQSTDRGNLSLYYHLLLNPNGGNVGIGTTSPSAKLDVLGSTNGGLFSITTTGQIPDIRLRQTNAVHPATRNWNILTNGSSYGSFQIGVSSDRYLDDYSPKFLIDGSGNVGIGTTSPSAKLDIAGGLQLSSATTSEPLYGMRVLSGLGTSLVSSYQMEFKTGSTPTQRMFINESGNVGIGTSSPQAPLDISNGYASMRSQLLSLTDAALQLRGTPDGTGYEHAKIYLGRDAGTFSYGSYLGFYTEGKNSGSTDASVERMRIDANGKVGIGTPNPDAKLAVNGTIHSTEVKVDAIVPTPDYVFDPEYKLRSLEDLKAYVDQNHHLPNIPSAKEIEKDGIQLGGMSMNLLKTIEELSLHVIELNNQLKIQKEEMETLKKELHKQPKL